MVAITEEKFGKYFAKSFKEVVLPALESMEERLALKKDIEELDRDLGMKIDTLDRKFDARQDRLDRQGKIHEQIEVKVETLESTVFPH